MNRAHGLICRSEWWNRRLEGTLVPWALDGLCLGEATLELGPGPGLTTTMLQAKAVMLLCVEVDRHAARALQTAGGNATRTVICADGATLPLRDERFDSVLAFTMLHHVAPAYLQDALFREVARVLRPGGVFAGTDSRDGWLFRLAHWTDTRCAVDPADLQARLRNAGFAAAEVGVRKHDFRFRAWRNE